MLRISSTNKLPYLLIYQGFPITLLGSVTFQASCWIAHMLVFGLSLVALCFRCKDFFILKGKENTFKWNKNKQNTCKFLMYTCVIKVILQMMKEMMWLFSFKCHQEEIPMTGLQQWLYYDNETWKNQSYFISSSFVFCFCFFGWFFWLVFVFLKKKKDVPVLQVVFTVPLGRGGNSTFGVCFGLFRTSAVNFVGVLYNI